MVAFILNGEARSIDVDSNTPLLWVIRDNLQLTGTKYGCGIGACGACTVHIDGEPTRSCSIVTGAVEGARVTTVEGLSEAGDHPVQQAWIEIQVPQCGYCQSGMIMATAALLDKNPNPSDEDINDDITNICRCGTYNRIRTAIHRAAEIKRG